MQLLNNEFTLDKFFDRLRNSPRSVLMLDYDGTLSPFTPDRDNAIPYVGVRDRLEELMKSSRTEVIIISGRDINRLKELLNLKSFPQMWGCHGAERYIPNLGHRLMIGQKIRDGLLEIKKWSKKYNLLEYTEFKPSGCAFHWRGKSEREAEKIMRLIWDDWGAEASRYNLNISNFDGGIEICAKGFNKGIAVDKIMSANSPDFAMAYLGDDLTDEDAFKALGERGLKVLVREKSRDSLADIQIIPPDELLEFFDKWIELTSKN